MAARLVDVEAMPEMLQLLCRVIAEHGKVMQVRRDLANADAVRANKEDASSAAGEQSRAWDEAVACLRRLVAWKPFSPAEEAQWQRLERVRTAKLRLGELNKIAPGGSATNAEEHAEAVRCAQNSYFEAIEAFLEEFVTPNKEDMEAAAEQATRFAAQAGSVSRSLEPRRATAAKASVAIPEAAQLRETCAAALRVADVTGDPRGRDNAEAATDRMADQLRNARDTLFFVDPANMTKVQRQDLETALETFQREAALAVSAVQERPVAVLVDALRRVEVYCKDLAKYVHRMDMVRNTLKNELRSPARLADELRAALEAVAASPAPGTLQARAELERERARFVRAFAGKPKLAEHCELLLDTVTALEGGMPLHPRPEIILSVAPWTSDDESAAIGKNDPVPAPLSRRCGLGLDGARVTTIAEQAPLRSHSYVVLRLDLRVDRKLSRPLLLPSAPLLLQAEKVFLDDHELCLAFRSVREGSMDMWLQGMQPDLPPFDVGRSVLEAVLTALVPMHKGGRAHGGVTADNIFINSAKRVIVGLPAPPGGPLLSVRTDMRSVVGLAERLIGGLDLPHEVRAALKSFYENAPNLSALKALEHRLFQVGIEHDCVVCFETKTEASGLKCNSEKHFICDECFEGHLCAQSEAGNSAALQQHNGAVLCVVPGCDSTPFHLKTVVEHVKEEIVDVYRNALKRESEIRVRQDAEKVMKTELDRVLSMRLTDLSVERHFTHVVEGILTLKCPNGHAFTDFDGCFALTCSTCNTFFCAYCLKGSPTDRENHRHVAECAEGSLANTVWGDFDNFTQHHARRREGKIKEYWPTVLADGNDVARLVRDRILPRMHDLEIRCDLPLR